MQKNINPSNSTPVLPEESGLTATALWVGG